MFEYVRAINTALDEGSFRKRTAGTRRAFSKYSTVFRRIEAGRAGRRCRCREPSNGEIDSYIEERQQAKKNRDFARADQIRALLESKGILLEDTKEGVRWKRK